MATEGRLLDQCIRTRKLCELLDSKALETSKQTLEGCLRGSVSQGGAREPGHSGGSRRGFDTGYGEHWPARRSGDQNAKAASATPGLEGHRERRYWRAQRAGLFWLVLTPCGATLRE